VQSVVPHRRKTTRPFSQDVHDGGGKVVGVVVGAGVPAATGVRILDRIGVVHTTPAPTAAFFNSSRLDASMCLSDQAAPSDSSVQATGHRAVPICLPPGQVDTPAGSTARHVIGGSLRPPGDDRRVAPPDDVSAFGHEIEAVLISILADGFVGAYFVGSVALGGFIRGESDIDVVAVCGEEVDEAMKQPVVEKVLEVTANCTRGLEFTLYRARVASSPRADTGFELNVNGGPRMPRSVHLSPHDEPRFWYVLDRAIAHRYGVAISGPPG
jgi:predicted nucleotidyltransferase